MSQHGDEVSSESILGDLVADIMGAVVSGRVASTAGAAVQGVTRTGLEATVEAIIRRRSHTRAANAAAMMRFAIAWSGLSGDEFVRRVELDLASERLTSAAIEASVDASSSEKLSAIARSLTAGLITDGRPGVDEQLLTIGALHEMESSHAWLLDRVVRWEPLPNSIIKGAVPPYGEAISIATSNISSRRRWTTSPHWTIEELRAGYTRHKTATSFDPVFGALVRRGILNVRDHFAASARSNEASDHVVRATGFGRRMHSLLVESQALDHLDEGELDIASADAWAYRGIPGWAKLEKYASVLGLSDSEAHHMAAFAAHGVESTGFRIETNRPPGETPILSRVADMKWPL